MSCFMNLCSLQNLQEFIAQYLDSLHRGLINPKVIFLIGFGGFLVKDYLIFNFIHQSNHLLFTQLQTITRITMATHNNDKPSTSGVYYGSDPENDDNPIYPQVKFYPSQSLGLKHRTSGGEQKSKDILQLIHEKVSEQSIKIDNLNSRLSSLEHQNRAILDTVMEMKRSFPSYTSAVPTSKLTIDRKYM